MNSFLASCLNFYTVIPVSVLVNGILFNSDYFIALFQTVIKFLWK